MKIELYDELGYVNIPAILHAGYPFNIIFGGRGTGKTYGALLYALNSDRKFMLMRRTQKQADKINNPQLSPFKSVCNDHPEFRIITKKLDDIGAVYDYELDEDGRIVTNDSPRGYTCALSTISNLRGFDASDVDLIIYDEFIPERHEKNLRDEGDAILNAYETINRNRELNGKKPVQFLALANSNRIDNPLFETLSLVNIAQEMADRRRAPVYTNRDKGLLFISLDASPISRKKKETALYKLTSGSDFEAMALDNRFTGVSFDNVRAANLNEFRPVVTVGEITIYKHKSDSRYHVAFHRSGSVRQYGIDETDLKRFRSAYANIWFRYIERNNVTFENAAALVLFEKYFT